MSKVKDRLSVDKQSSVVHKIQLWRLWKFLHRGDRSKFGHQNQGTQRGVVRLKSLDLSLSMRGPDRAQIRQIKDTGYIRFKEAIHIQTRVLAEHHPVLNTTLNACVAITNFVEDVGLCGIAIG